jgi:hypothetical protein
MNWDIKDLERFVRATSCTLTTREWESTKRNMVAYYSSDGALPNDPRVHAWFGRVPDEHEWDSFVMVTDKARAEVLTMSEPKAADPSHRREYHRLYQQRRRFLEKQARESAAINPIGEADAE